MNRTLFIIFMLVFSNFLFANNDIVDKVSYRFTKPKFYAEPYAPHLVENRIHENKSYTYYKYRV